MNDLDTLAALVELARRHPDKIAIAVRVGGYASVNGFGRDPGDAPQVEPEVDIDIDMKIRAPESEVRDALAKGLIGTSINRFLKT